MPRTCTVCRHPQRPAIDRALATESTPNRRIATHYGVSESAIRRHRSEHLSAALATAANAERVADADELLGQLQELRRRALAILDRAERVGELRTALAAIREARATIELLLEVEGEIDRRGVTNVTINAEWVELRTLIIAALEDHPDARIAVADRLRMLEGENGS